MIKKTPLYDKENRATASTRAHSSTNRATDNIAQEKGR